MISCYCALLSFDQRASAKVSGTIDAALARPAARSEPLLKQAPREAVQAQVQRVLLGEQGGRRRLVPLERAEAGGRHVKCAAGVGQLEAAGREATKRRLGDACFYVLTHTEQLPHCPRHIRIVQP